MTSTNIFGRIVTPRMVEAAVVTTLDRFMRDYLAEVERLDGYPPGTIELPRGIITRHELEAWPSEQIPLLLVMNMGTDAKPERRADSSYRAPWAVTVVAIVKDVDQSTTHDVMTGYGTAVRALILQHKSLGGFANDVAWQGEDYSGVPALAERSLAAAQQRFTVGVEGVVTEYAGPREPLPDPLVPGDWPFVTDIKPPVITPVGLEGSLHG